MTTSKTERTNGNPFPTGIPEAAKYNKTTITDNDGQRFKGCDKDASKSQEKAQDKYERAHKS